MATSEEANGNLWCELLSSVKDRNVKEFKENKSSHHFSIMVVLLVWYFITNEFLVSFYKESFMA